MEILPHPTHHRPFTVACGVGIAVGAVSGLILFSIGKGLPAIGLFLVMVVGSLAWTRIYCRYCTCPRCARRLDRDADSPRGTNLYSCAACGVTWESQIVSIG